MRFFPGVWLCLESIQVQFVEFQSLHCPSELILMELTVSYREITKFWYVSQSRQAELQKQTMLLGNDDTALTAH